MSKIQQWSSGQDSGLKQLEQNIQSKKNQSSTKFCSEKNKNKQNKNQPFDKTQHEGSEFTTRQLSTWMLCLIK